MNENNQEQPQDTQTAESTPKPQANPVNPTPPPTPPLQPNETISNKTLEKPIKSGGLAIKTLLLILVLAAISAGLIFVALNKKPVEEIVQQPNEIISPALDNPVQTILSISSTPVRLSTPSAYSTNITINTGKNLANKVQLEISYNPQLITNVSVENGRFFTNPQVFLKEVDALNGRITFAIGVQDGEEGILGQGVVAKLNFTAFQQVATTSVTLLPKTEVTADGFAQSVLKTTVDALFNLNETPFKATMSAN